MKPSPESYTAAAYYFGCIRTTGHHLFSPGGACVDFYGFEVPNLDQSYCPAEGVAQGASRLTHIKVGRNEWSILSFWDNSIDKRPGSHSTFVVRGTFDYDDTKNVARTYFPGVWDRYTFHVHKYTP